MPRLRLQAPRLRGLIIVSRQYEGWAMAYLMMNTSS